MAETLLKLSPHRDLQCYFLTPSAIAAMSNSSPTGFTLSGKWRQQFDWAVVEWNRDNVFEHPALRYLPDGDLSGLHLSYTEQRTGCVPVESNLFPTVDWDKLRVWVPNADGSETTYYIPLAQHKTPIGAHVSASGTMTLTAIPAAYQHVGLAILEEHYYYTVAPGDSLTQVAAGIAAAINSGSATFTASSSNTSSVTVYWNEHSPTSRFPQLLGANGNRISMYGFAQAGFQAWLKPSATFAGGLFPQAYQIDLNFSNLCGWKVAGDTNQANLVLVPFKNVRKMRWTWSADLQPSSFLQTEFHVTVSNWNVTGTGRQHFIAGPGSRRLEENDPGVVLSPEDWTSAIGNYSGSRIVSTNQTNATCTIFYSEPAAHTLYIGTRFLEGGSTVRAVVDGAAPQQFNLNLPGEDVLIRLSLGIVQAGSHTVVLTNLGVTGAANPAAFYFDFLEIAYPSAELPDFVSQPKLSLATDWDTYHAQSLPAERTAWMINKLGFTGRVNHYTGALWFYEMNRPGTHYATLTLTLNLLSTTTNNSQSAAAILDVGATGTDATRITHLILPDDTVETLTQAFACLINLGANAVWAAAKGDQLTLTAREMGTLGNTGIFVSVDSQSAGFSFSAPASALGGGVDGNSYSLDATDWLQSTFMAAGQHWCTDLTAKPAINRAARDWHQAYFTALKSYGMDVVAAFSTELGNGDTSLTAGIAQRYPDGTPALVSTPALQTNFSPTSLAYWQQVYLDIADIQNLAGVQPYLQSGEVQWWYFPKYSWSSSDTHVDALVGMPFYDTYTQQQFQLQFAKPMQVIRENSADPSEYPNEVTFLPSLIGSYTSAIRNALQAKYPGSRYEVLYPTDTNDTPLNSLVNYPATDWTPRNLTCLKTESFTFTNNRNLDQSLCSMNLSAAKGFPNAQRSHLIGIGDAWTAWMKEADLAQSQGLESVVLFALDQYCLIGYPAPPFTKSNRSLKQG